MEEMAIVIASIGGVAAAFSAYIAHRSHQYAREIYKLHPKRDVLRRLVGSSHLLTPAMAGYGSKAEPLTALNEAVAVFANDATVVEKLLDFKRNAGRSELLVPLFRAMADSAEVNLEPFDDDFLITPFTAGNPTTTHPP